MLLVKIMCVHGNHVYLVQSSNASLEAKLVSVNCPKVVKVRLLKTALDVCLRGMMEVGLPLTAASASLKQTVCSSLEKFEIFL